MMATARIFDPAGPTSSFFFDTAPPNAMSSSPTKLAFQALILSGSFAGRTATIEWLGSFNLAAETGTVTAMRELVDGKLCFSFAIDTPIPLDDLFGGLDAVFAGGFRFIGNRFQNHMAGDLGHDTLLGAAGNDTLLGGAGNDALYGGPGQDRLVGEAGNDLVAGGAHPDTVFGGLGHDVLDGRDTSIDRLLGGPGNDRYLEFANHQGEDVIAERAGEGYDVVLSFSQGYQLPGNVEELRMVGAYDNTRNANGNNQHNVIVGSTGRDFINAFGGNDRLGAGDGDDMLTGFLGNDILAGGAGNDELWDFYGNNVLSGGAGNDSLEAGGGKDRLAGGADADRFIFATVEAAGFGAARDLVTDFVSGTDKVVLEFMDANAIQAQDQDFAFIGSAAFSGTPGEVRFSNGILFGNTDADPLAEFTLQLAGVTSLAAADLVL
jgi:Ca2+-binding RTX toxin-like protein